MQINVKNGTRAGWRRIRQQVKRDWKCDGCGASCRYYWKTCPVCDHPRPH